MVEVGHPVEAGCKGLERASFFYRIYRIGEGLQDLIWNIIIGLRKQITNCNSSPLLQI